MADDTGDLHESAGQVQPEAPKTPAQAAETAIVKEAVDNFAFVCQYEDAQRKAEEEELDFADVDMWDVDARSSRDEHTDENTGRKVAARPALSVNLIDQNTQQVISEARQARLALTVKPRTGMANTTNANHYKGLIRTIQVDSGALAVRLWALERTAKVGRGCYEILADYANDGDFDIDLQITRVLDQSTVYWDPYAQAADNRDAEWNITTSLISEDTRKRKWPNKPLTIPEGAFDGDKHPWFTTDANNPQQRFVRIATYRKVIHTEKTLVHHPQRGTLTLEELPALERDAIKRAAIRTRTVDQRTVMMYILDGTQVLEAHPWLGRFIPTITTVGKEYLHKGKRRYKGIVANAVDISRAINVLISSATELAGKMPRNEYLMAAGQDAGFEEMWDDAPIKNYSRLYYNTKDIDGNEVGPPQRANSEPQIQGLMFLLRMLLDMFHAVTGSVAPQLRAVNPYDRSGKAIDLLQRQGAAGTSNYLDNLATISMPYEGMVLVDAIPKYYDRPGRILRIAAEEKDDESAIMIKRPFVLDDDGNPVPIPCPTCGGTGTVQRKASTWNPFAPLRAQTCPDCEGSTFATKATMPKDFHGQAVHYVDFADGEYKVVPVIDRDYRTKQDEALAGMAQLAQASPELVPAYAAAWVRAMGFAGSNDVAESIDAFTNPNKEFDAKKVPPQVLAAFRQLQAQHQQAMQALQEAQKLLDTDAVKTAGTRELAVIKAGLQEKLERIKAQGKVMEASTAARADQAITLLQGQIKTMQQEAEHRHEIILELLKEQKEKEIERHSVALHAAAAQAAAKEADLSADHDLLRGEIVADRQAGREEQASERQAHREDHAATRQAGRDDNAASRQHAREEGSAERQASRDSQEADRQAQRDQAAADREAARAAKEARRDDTE